MCNNVGGKATHPKIIRSSSKYQCNVVFVCLSVCLSICLSVCLWVHVVYVFVHICIHHVSMYVHTYMCIHANTCYSLQVFAVLGFAGVFGNQVSSLFTSLIYVHTWPNSHSSTAALHTGCALCGLQCHCYNQCQSIYITVEVFISSRLLLLLY